VRENRTHGSEGGEDGVLSYPYFIRPCRLDATPDFDEAMSELDMLTPESWPLLEKRLNMLESGPNRGKSRVRQRAYRRGHCLQSLDASV
jgi:hypothetical protein